MIAISKEQQHADRLEKLAEDISKSHDLIGKHLGDAVKAAINAGRSLKEAKETVKHGHWKSFVRENCGFSLRTAQRYMQLYERRDDIDAASSVGDALSVIGRSPAGTKSVTHDAFIDRPISVTPPLTGDLKREVQAFESGKENPHDIKVRIKLADGREIDEPISASEGRRMIEEMRAPKESVERQVADSICEHLGECLDTIETISSDPDQAFDLTDPCLEEVREQLRAMLERIDPASIRGRVRAVASGPTQEG